MKEIRYEGCLMTDSKWKALFESMKDERVVLVIGDGFINVGETPLDDYLKEKILEKARAEISDSDAYTRLEEQCKKAKSLTDLLELCGNYMTDGEGHKDIEGQLNRIIEDIDDQAYDASMLQDLLAIGRFNVILSTSVSNKFRYIVEDYAYKTHRCSYIANW